MSIKFKVPDFDTSKPVEVTASNGKTVTAYPVSYSSTPSTPLSFKEPKVDTSGPVELTKYDGSTVTAYPSGSLPEPVKSTNYSYDVPKPVYESKYSGKVADLLDAIAGHKPFSYDVESDPLYSQYRKQYLREGKRATEDVMGSYAGMTGGIPSSYAVTAAAQAGNYYNSQLNDKVSELYELAYSKYRDEYDDMYKKLNMYMTADDLDYGRHRDDVSDWYDERQYNRDVYESDRDYQFDVNKYSDEKEYNDWYRDYQERQLAEEIAKNDRDFQYKVNVYSDEKAANERADLLELLEAVGSIPSESGTTGSLSGVETLPGTKENAVASGVVGNGVAGALPEPVYGKEASPSVGYTDGTIKQPSEWTTAVLQNMQYGSDNYYTIVEMLRSAGISDEAKANYIYNLTQNGLSDEIASRMFSDIGLNFADYTY